MMGVRSGETIELLIDDTRVAKRGRQMAALQKIWDHAHQRFVRGHIWVVAAIRFRGVVLPWRIELWKPRKVAAANSARPRRTRSVNRVPIELKTLPTVMSWSFTNGLVRPRVFCPNPGGNLSSQAPRTQYVLSQSSIHHRGNQAFRGIGQPFGHTHEQIAGSSRTKSC